MYDHKTSKYYTEKIALIVIHYFVYFIIFDTEEFKF